MVVLYMSPPSVAMVINLYLPQNDSLKTATIFNTLESFPSRLVSPVVHTENESYTGLAQCLIFRCGDWPHFPPSLQRKASCLIDKLLLVG